MGDGRILILDEKQALYNDGYVILKKVIPDKILKEARNALSGHSSGFDKRLGYDSRMTDLINKSSLNSILSEAIGNFDPPSACHVAVREFSEPSQQFNNVGYRDEETPYFGASIHMDGLLSINAPQEIQHGSPQEIYNRYIASGPKGDLGRSPEVLGHNLVPLFQDPATTLSIGSFTALVFVSLSDQTKEGSGQTGVLKGAHHPMEEFFKWQKQQGSLLGPEGPGWDRLNHSVPNHCGLVYLPDAVNEQFLDDSCETTSDGRRWPKPTQILMEPGDACISIYQLPHTGTRNEKGTESRKSVIFRIRHKKRQPDVIVDGFTDHPDRGLMGEWLEFEPNNDPWERSKEAICNMWDEWDGMQQVVAANQSPNLL